MIEPLDNARLGELRSEFTADELRAICEQVASGMDESFARLAGALAAGAPADAAAEAHRARNDALVVGAFDLASLLGELEASARAADADRAAATFAAVRAIWPRTRAAIVSACAA